MPAVTQGGAALRREKGIQIKANAGESKGRESNIIIALIKSSCFISKTI